MSFFKSEVVRAEMVEISEMQEEICGSIFTFHSMSKDDKINHVNLLERLLHKQQILYTRLSLSDDPEAQEMKNRVSQSAEALGLPPNVDMNIIFGNMVKMLEEMKKQIDKTGSDL
jgi:hypothetical protein